MKTLSFLTQSEIKISRQFKKDGFVIREAANLKSLQWIKKKNLSLLLKKFKFHKDYSESRILNFIHKKVPRKNLNNFRLDIYNKINNDPNFKYHYFQVAKPYIEAIAGNELAMQKINLSIQLPQDDSSLLAVHSDVWAGDSPFEIVVWVPLVDCYKTKTMYILPPKKISFLIKSFEKKNIQIMKKFFN